MRPAPTRAFLFIFKCLVNDLRRPNDGSKISLVEVRYLGDEISHLIGFFRIVLLVLLNIVGFKGKSGIFLNENSPI